MLWDCLEIKRWQYINIHKNSQKIWIIIYNESFYHFSVGNNKHRTKLNNNHESDICSPNRKTIRVFVSQLHKQLDRFFAPRYCDGKIYVKNFLLIYLTYNTYICKQQYCAMFWLKSLSWCYCIMHGVRRLHYCIIM